MDSFYGECEQSPPSPTQCPEVPNSKYCLILRETTFAGVQIRFARDCTVSYYEENCVVQNITATKRKNVCFRTCGIDGCNSNPLVTRSASSKTNPPSKFAMLMSTMVMMMIMSIMNMVTHFVPLNIINFSIWNIDNITQ
uniref:UPAR/Ly6 domain-containing protein n=2 Tax=Octopus bimaculoides TaxID=37653 RepID=A0A0L8GQ77_OCTBM